MSKEPRLQPKPMSRLKYSALWATRDISWNAAIAFFAYTTFFATDVMHISATTVGIIMIVSKIIDSGTDILVGYLIDKTNTRWGKARPYEIAIIGYWGVGMLLYMAPLGSMRFLILYFFIMYNIRQDIFSTMLACDDPVYYATSVPDKSWTPKVLAFKGIAGFIVTAAFGVFLPSMITWAGEDRHSWMVLSLAFGIPFILLGLVRAMTIPEIRTLEKAERDDFNFFEGLKIVAKNKYIWYYAIAVFFTYFAYNLQSNSVMYYAKYVLGDGNLGVVITVSALGGFFVILLQPTMIKKFGMNKTAMITLGLSLIGYLGRLINPYDPTLQFIFGVIAQCAIMPFWNLINMYLMDIMDYGEWKIGIRGEGIYAAIFGMSNKFGMALGMGGAALIPGMFGYDSLLAQQPQSAVNAIIAMFTWLPFILVVIALIGLKFYDLDGKIDQIRVELGENKKAKESLK